ncbi:sensor histidine kinase [Streptomyces sp. NPDC092369]|uniref:sensor histidine kinase n=1 Tax=Streptomyces sp. NPDC092369 TaxID=3366015 RepID=UPI0037F6124E
MKVPAWRPRSIRWRLTLLYSALFVAAGALLLGFVYGLAAHSAGVHRTVSSVEGPGIPEAGALPTAPATVSAFAEIIREDQLHDLLVYAALALAAMALASVALGWVMAGRVLAPLRTMTATARRISADNLHERLAVAGPDDELKAVADTFDDVLARLAGSFEAQKQFVANASHELRTPLTLQQAVVDVALADPDASADELRGALRRVRAAGQEQERLIDALLTLARSQRGLERRESVDLTAMVRDRLPVVDGCRVEARLEPAPVLGDPQLIERLVVNLTENAVRHNLPAGEDGWVSVWTGVDAAGRPGLRIENSGPVIPADQAAGLFEPFRRLGPERVAPQAWARSRGPGGPGGAQSSWASQGSQGSRGRGRERDGVGLGLSIVAAVVAAHGGRVWARTRPRGGLTVEVSLPGRGTREGASAAVTPVDPALPRA